jgi:hypothetical protein
MIASGKTSHVFLAMAIGAVLMILGGLAEIAFGVKAERRSLEAIAKPLTAVQSAARRSASTAPGAVTAARTRSAPRPG